VYYSNVSFYPCAQVAIIEYLDETQGPPYLLPKGDPVKRQLVRDDTILTTFDPSH